MRSRDWEYTQAISSMEYPSSNARRMLRRWMTQGFRFVGAPVRRADARTRLSEVPR